MAAQGRVLARHPLQTGALLLQLVLELVDLVLLEAELPLQELLVEVALAAGEHRRRHEKPSRHATGPRRLPSRG
ncbi:MAG: hypothetical protein ACK56I_27090, partial [bacterium]